MKPEGARLLGKKREELIFDHAGQVDVEAIRDEREPSTVPYAPCPSPDAKWKALAAVCAMPKWSGVMKGVMACFIEHANYYGGKCCPSMASMAERLDCTERAVKKAVGAIERGSPKFLQVYRRSVPGKTGWKANGYVIGWRALINRCHAVFPWTERGNKRSPMETPDRRHRDATDCERGNKRSAIGEQTFQTSGNGSSPEYIEEEIIEGRYRPKRAHPPSAADANDIFSNLFPTSNQQPSECVERPQGIQCGEGGTASTPKVGGVLWWKNRLADAEKELGETNNPEGRKVVVAKIARLRARIEDMNNEQSGKAASGTE